MGCISIKSVTPGPVGRLLHSGGFFISFALAGRWATFFISQVELEGMAYCFFLLPRACFGLIHVVLIVLQAMFQRESGSSKLLLYVGCLLFFQPTFGDGVTLTAKGRGGIMYSSRISHVVSHRSGKRTGEGVSSASLLIMPYLCSALSAPCTIA